MMNALVMILNIVFAVSFALSAVCLVLIIMRSKTDEPRYTMPSFFGAVGIAGTLVMAFIASLPDDSLSSEGGFAIGFLLFFLLLSDSLSLSCIFTRIEFDNTGFTRRNFLGISRRYEYRDITEARKGRSFTLFFGKKKVGFPSELALSNPSLIFKITSGYARYHGGDDIPEKDDSGSFFGNKIDYEQGMTLFVVYILLFLIIIGLWVLSAVVIKPVSSDSPDIVPLNIVLTDYEYTHGNELELFSDGMEEYFQIDSCDRKEAACGEIIAAIKAGKSFGIAGISYNDNNDNPYYEVRNLTIDGRVLISYDDTNADDERERRIAEYVICGVCVFWMLFGVVSIRIIRNPENYSERFKHLFFSDSLWK